MDELRKYLLSLGFYRGMQPAGADSMSSPVGKSNGRTVVPCVTVDFPRSRRDPEITFWVNGAIFTFSDSPGIAWARNAYVAALKAHIQEVIDS